MICETRVFSIFIPHSASLKQRRGVVKSILQKIRNRFNVSVIELSGMDVWQRADIGVAVLANRKDLAEREIEGIGRQIEKNGEVLITRVSETRPDTF